MPTKIEIARRIQNLSDKGLYDMTPSDVCDPHEQEELGDGDREAGREMIQGFIKIFGD